MVTYGLQMATTFFLRCSQGREMLASACKQRVIYNALESHPHHCLAVPDILMLHSDALIIGLG